jgi:hypothetical protein
VINGIELHTELIDVFLVLVHVVGEWDNIPIVVFTDRRPAFRKDEDFMPRKIIMFDGFANDFFRLAVGIVVRGVPLFNLVTAHRMVRRDTNSGKSPVVGSLQQGQSLTICQSIS